MFHNNQFHFVPWQTVSFPNSSSSLNPDFKAPRPLVIDNSTLRSLDNTYAILEQDLTRPLQKLNKSINSVHGVSYSNSFEPLTYLTLALASCNFVVVWIIYCILSKKLAKNSSLQNVHQTGEVFSHKTDQSTSTSV